MVQDAVKLWKSDAAPVITAAQSRLSIPDSVARVLPCSSAGNPSQRGLVSNKISGVRFEGKLKGVEVIQPPLPSESGGKMLQAADFRTPGSFAHKVSVKKPERTSYIPAALNSEPAAFNSAPVQLPHEPTAVLNSYQQLGANAKSSPVTLDVQDAALLKAAGSGSRPSYADIVKDQRAAAPRNTSTPLRKQNSAPLRSFHDADCKAMGQIIDVGGKKTASFSTSELEELASPFVFSLIGKFSHGFPSMRVLKFQMAKFNLKGECHISLLEQKHVLIRLSCEEDCTRLWSRQVLYIAGFPMKMLKWTPNFKPGMEPALAPIWVLLPYLPVHLFDRRSLFTICSAIGKPLRIDSATANLTRASTPRICVEIDLSKKLMSEVPILLDGEHLLQEVEYESVPKYCDRCKHLGHGSDKCSMDQPPKSPQRQPVCAHNVEIPASPGDSIFVEANGRVGILPDQNNSPLDKVFLAGIKEDIVKSYELFGNIQETLLYYDSAGDSTCKLKGAYSDIDAPEEYYTEGNFDWDLPPIIIPPKNLVEKKVKKKKTEKLDTSNPRIEEQSVGILIC